MTRTPFGCETGDTSGGRHYLAFFDAVLVILATGFFATDLLAVVVDFLAGAAFAVTLLGNGRFRLTRGA